MYIFFSFLTGITIVLNMMLNGRLAQREGMITGVLINYLMATAASAVLCGAMINSIPAYAVIKGVPLPYFLGGLIGVFTTYLFNIIVLKVPAVYIVILRFIGQMLASAAIDYVYLDVFSKGKVIGGVLFLIGLILNARVDSKHQQKSLELSDSAV